MANDVLIWFIVVAVNWVVFGIPIMKIVQRTGRYQAGGCCYFTGIGTIVGLWLLAYCRWPAVDDRPQ
jgi:hypothetical protein